MAKRVEAYGLRVGVGLAIAAAALAPLEGVSQEAPRYTNLQVLPSDISRGELNEVMLANLLELGLPRRANRGCLFCHAGSMDVPSSEWGWASDEKPMKRKARVMMAMVQDINGTHLSALPTRSEPEVDVGCYTCRAVSALPHRGYPEHLPAPRTEHELANPTGR